MDFGASISMIIIACLSVIAAKNGVTEIVVLGAVLCRSMFRIFNFQFASSKNIHGRHRIFASSEGQ